MFVILACRPAPRGNNPGALVVTDGTEATREKKLLAWASDYAAQRAELVKAKTELTQVGLTDDLG